jgi:hypothetical protein
MGGHALKSIETVRLETPEYNRLILELIPLVQNIFETKTYNAPCYRAKQSHGDMDILILNDGGDKFNHIRELIVENFNPTEINHNSNVYSFDYEKFQIDFIFISDKNWETAKTYFSYDPIGNIMGKYSKKFNLSFGWDGLKYTHYIEDKKLGEFVITKDLRKIFTFLGFDYDKYLLGFDTLEEIFEYLVDNKYFNKQMFEFDNLTGRDRKRNKKRTTFHQFLDYIQTIEDRDFYVFEKDKAKYLSLIDEYFPECNIIERIEEYKEKEKTKKEIAKKFNGDIIMEIYPNLKDKELGNFISNFKKYITEAENMDFDTYLLNNTGDIIKLKIITFYNSSFFNIK